MARMFDKEVVKEVRRNEIRLDGGSKGKQYHLLPYRGEKWNPKSFLDPLPAADKRFSWEYYKKDSGVQYIRNWTETSLKRITNKLQGSFHNSQAREDDGTFFEMDGYCLGACSTLEMAPYYPLKLRGRDHIEGSEKSGITERETPGEYILGALQDATGEWLIQIFFQKAPEGWDSYLLYDDLLGIGPRSSKNKLKENEKSETSRELGRDIEKKLNAGSQYKTQIRILGSKADKHSLKQDFEIIKDVFSHFGYRNDRGNNFDFEKIPAEDLFDFLGYMKRREWYFLGRWDKFTKRWLNHYDVTSAEELRWLLELPTDKLDKYKVKTGRMKAHDQPVEQLEAKQEGELGEAATKVGEDSRGDSVFIPDFSEHTFVCGATGTGKSTLLENIALEKVNDDENIVVLDPHGDLAINILRKMPKEKLTDVLYLGPLSPLGLNALQVPDFPKGDAKKLSRMEKRRLREAEEGAKEKAVESLKMMMKQHFGEQFWGPRLESIFEWFTLGLLEDEGSNFVDFYHILQDEDIAEEFARDTEIPEIENYVNKFYNQLDDRDRHSTLNKVGKIRRSKILRKMLCIRDPDIDVSEMIEPGKIVIVNLSKGIHDQDRIHFLGSVIAIQIWSSIVQKGILDESKRSETYLVADEFQNIGGPVYETMLSEGRKYGLRLILATQYIDQLDDSLWKAVIGNAGNLCSFRVHDEDSEVLDRNFGDTVERHEFTNLQDYNMLMRTSTISSPVRVKTLPPRPLQYEKAEEYVLKKMNDISQNPGYKYQEANTPRWESHEADTWDILTGIWRKQIELNRHPTVKDLSEEEPRNNLSYRLGEFAEKGVIEYDRDEKKIWLNDRSRQEIFDLMGRSGKAGKERHKERIMHLFEALTSLGFRVNIVRQSEPGLLPDMTLAYSNRDDIRWSGKDIEVECDTLTKPSRVLKNLAKGENEGREVFFFVESKDEAEKLVNIISYPYKDDGERYDGIDEKEFRPESEFDRRYWKPNEPIDHTKLCKIFVFKNGEIREFKSRKGLEDKLVYERGKQGDYIIDKETEFLEETKIEEHEAEGTEESQEDGLKTVAPPTLQGMDDTDENELREIAFEALDDSEDILEKIEEKFPAATEEMKRGDTLLKKWEREWGCSNIRSKSKQPDEMKLDLIDICLPCRGLTLLVEGLVGYMAEHGYQIPSKKLTTAELKEGLTSHLDAEIPENYGNQVAKFLDRWYIEKERDPTHDQNAFDLPNWAEFFMDIYHYSTVKNIEDGSYTYPALYETLDKGLSRYTCSKIFPKGSEKKIHGAELSFYTISETEKDVLLDEMIHAPEEVVNIEYLTKKTPFDASQLKDIADRWNIEIVKTDEGEKLDLAFLQEQIPRLQ